MYPLFCYINTFSHTLLRHTLATVALCLPLWLTAQEISTGTYTFRDGAVYQGEVFRGKPYGKGRTTFKNGDVYEGEYVKGKRQGAGIYTFVDICKHRNKRYNDKTKWLYVSCNVYRLYDLYIDIELEINSIFFCIFFIIVCIYDIITKKQEGICQIF